MLEDNDIFSNVLHGVSAEAKSRVAARRNRITTSGEAGIRVMNDATCIAENNDLRGNKTAWDIEKPRNVTRNGNQE